jgi:pyruvate kinase
LSQAISSDIECVGLSFANSGDDVLHVQQLCQHSRTKVIPKIESKDSVKRLGEIVELADEVIIDRGDLSGEIGLEKIWRVQREIIGAAKRNGTRVYAATQVLASMVRNPLPSIAEIDSLYSLIHEGIDGIQLSEETSVGHHAVDAIRVIHDVFEDKRRQTPSLRMAVV